MKRLTAVDADSARSHQHEIGTTRNMRVQFLGENHRQKFRTVYIRLDDSPDRLVFEGSATHYNARHEHEARAPEWRLYYSSNPVTEAMHEGDTLFLARRANGILYFIVTPASSTTEQQLAWLFGQAPVGSSFESRSISGDGGGLGFAAQFILDLIGIESDDLDTDGIDAVIDRFGMDFPRTAEFSKLARATLPDIDARADPDRALTAWLGREGEMFYQLERRIVGQRLRLGFVTEDGVDMKEFIDFALTVLNRRKSRMGRALEHHLAATFDAFQLSYSRDAETERGQWPDFLFPGIEAYHDAPHTGHSSLIFLGAKSTCKDRWRQILPEASKIPRKHLLTLDPGITEAQTDQMKAADVQLVVPRSLQQDYTDRQRQWIWDIATFIRFALMPEKS